MAPLYWAPCIVYGAVRYYLPPACTLKDQWGQEVEVLSPRYTSRAVIVDVNDNQPVRLSVSAKGVDVENQRAILDWMEEIRQQLRGKTFALYLFHDRGYEKCALEGADWSIPLSPLVRREMDLQFVSEDLMTVALEPLDFPGGYDVDYPYASKVGRPQGDANETGVIPVMQSSYQTPSGHFPGLAAVTAVGDDQSIMVGGTENSQWSLESVQVIGGDDTGNEAGSTTVTVSTQPVGIVGQTLTSTVAAGDKYGTPSAQPAIQVTAGSRIYVSISAAGGHSDVQYLVRLKAL